MEVGDSSQKIEIKKFQTGLSKEHSVHVGKIKFVFVFQLLNNTSEISSICKICHKLDSS